MNESIIKRLNTPERNVPYVEGIRVGKRSTLDSIYTNFFPKIQNFIIHHSGTPDDAKDIFQEALLVIYNNVSESNFKLTCQFGTYLHAICRNIWFKQIRKKSNQITINSDDLIMIDKDELEEATMWLEKYKIYKHQFQNLGEKCQELLKLYIEGIDMKSIARKMGFANVSYARKRKFKCKEQLIFKIEEDPDYKKLMAND